MLLCNIGNYLNKRYYLKYIGWGMQSNDKQQYKKLKHCSWLENNNYRNILTYSKIDTGMC